MIFQHRRIYVCGFLLWIASGTLFPTWLGRSYSHVNHRNPGKWRNNGLFRLQNSSGYYKRGPLFDPPQAASTSLKATVRWPWQRPRNSHHVELAWAKVISQWSVGTIALGVVLWIINRRQPSKQPDLLLSIAWSTSLSLIIAWLCIFVLAAFSMGYAATDTVVASGLALGVVAGVGFGLKIHSNGRTIIEATVLNSDSATTDTIESDANHQVRQVGTGLLWFTLGILTACCLAYAAGLIASVFRGPTVGVTVLGTPRYAYGQTSINRTTAAGLVGSGWLLGILLLRQRRFRAFRLGLILVTTGLGLLYWFHF
ncbi:MAG: hypothetical protein VX346_00235 [Planctomycetota bacterium]|nr:hypothetical protein [Planctomycetota bacterium]